MGLYRSADSGNTWLKLVGTSNQLPGINNPEAAVSYNFGNTYKIACDGTGTKLIMTTNYGACIYQSNNSGIVGSWSLIYNNSNYVSKNDALNITCNANGEILYAALNNSNNISIIASKDYGVSWSTINTGAIGRFLALTTNSYRDILFTISKNNYLNVFYPIYNYASILSIPTGGNTYTAINTYNNGNNIIVSQRYYSVNTRGAVVLYSVYNKYPPGPPPIPCFKILCFKENMEIYIKIQDIRKGDFVKTLNNGYLPVDIIGQKEIYHPAINERIKYQLYKCTSDEYPDVFEDLIITGCHSSR